MRIIFSAAMACALVGPASAGLLFDQGASTGAYGGSWTSWTTEQNFLDQVTLTSTSRIDRFTTYTEYDPAGFTGPFHLKLYSDAAGDPGTSINGQDVAVTSYSVAMTSDSTSVYAVELDLVTPWYLTGGTKYWVGASANSFNTGAISLLTPGDGRMAQYFDTTYLGATDVGDLAFQLHGEAVPEPASMVVLGLGAVAFLRRKR